MKNIIFLLTMLLPVFCMAQSNSTPEPTGKYAVGRKLFEWVDLSRIDESDPNRKRTLPVWVWYPAVKKSTTSIIYPLNEQWRAAQNQYLVTKVGQNAADFLSNLGVHSITDAVPAKDSVAFPVLLFGPGHTWLPTDYSTIIEDIVSYGYIVVGYIPTGFPGVTQLSNGELVKGNLKVPQFELTYKDAEFVQSKLQELETGYLKGVMNSKALGFFGHSQGGITGAYRTANDPAIQAYVNLMGSAALVKIRQPSWLISNDERAGIAGETEWGMIESLERSEYRRHADWMKATDSAATSVRIRIPSTRHLNFNDLALVPADAWSEKEKKHKVGTLDGAKGLLYASTLTRMVFDEHLKKLAPATYKRIKQLSTELSVLLLQGLPIN